MGEGGVGGGRRKIGWEGGKGSSGCGQGCSNRCDHEVMLRREK